MHSAWACAALLCFLWTSCRADEKSFLKNKKFNDGEFGNYPRNKFKTSLIEPPRPNFMLPFTDCDDGSYIFVTPRGTAAWSSLFILDHEGGMIWGPDHRYGEIYNFQTQMYKGEQYLSFWAGDDSVGGHGEGKYYLFDQHYNEHRTLSTGEGLRGDLHTFFITPENTAVYTVYQVVQADLTSMGKEKDSWIWDSQFKELDLDSGEVLFEWKASDHFPFPDSYSDPKGATHGDPWDFFHINTVQKDKTGNFLISSRYARAVLYISKDTRETLWQLGGKNNSFKDLSHGDASSFLGQHDVHWVDDTLTEITMFDNRGDWYNKIEDESVAHRIRLDTQRMTAELVQSYRHPQHILSTSQGSAQTLPNGNLFVGYGFNGVFTEYDRNGTALCDATMMPAIRFGTGDVQSYRNLKLNWTGIPLTVPSLIYEDRTLYVSWLGSTKVRSWAVQDCDTADGLFQSAQTVKKEGFETEIALEDSPRMRRYVRIIAVDGGGTQLSISNPVDLIDPVEIWGPLKEGEYDPQHHSNLGGDSRFPVPSDPSTPGSSSSSNIPALTAVDLIDTQILLVLAVLAAISAAGVAWLTMNSGCCGWARRRGGIVSTSEKILHPLSPTSSRFLLRVDGRWRRLWHRARQQLQASLGRPSWQYGQIPPLEPDERDLGSADRMSSSSERFAIGEG